MLKIEGKTFMNIQEAVQWLLDNNALPFQCSANYQANTEIGLGTIVNPSPAKVRIGSLIFFTDSKVSTVTGLTENGFICSDQYNNLVDDIAYVTNVSINASGHLITTLSDGQTIDAGIVKQVSGFSINASQHLIVTYNDGTTSDLGAIFSGSITISGNIVATGYMKQGIAEFSEECALQLSNQTISAGITKADGYSKIIAINGALYVVMHFSLTNPTASDVSVYNIGARLINLPTAIASKIYDFDGSPASAIVNTPCMITMGSLTVSQSKTDNNSALQYVNFGLYHADHPSGNRVAISIAQSAGLTIPAGATRYFSGRFSLTLIE